ncbi:Gfo/Idh/MocA family protein [Inquilinus sp. CA228]|uniref:Gfo/Idh/MocA family protein n=1 Tax=Inquilinus sp. CA228 TaxID=3455609 RepID=UPI003F8D58A8
MARILNVGVVGCGEAAQLLHLPTLRELPDLFKVSALSDPSPMVLDGVAGRTPGAVSYTTPDDLLRDPAVDVVLIASPHVFHAQMVLMAMQAGKHILVEKPMCLTVAEADALVEAEAKHGVVAQVGYQRRHAPAFEDAVRRVQRLAGRINLARVHDVIGANQAFIRSTTPAIKGTDVPSALVHRANALLAEKTFEAIGIAEGPLAAAYGFLLGLSSHDISAMRELLGMPRRVLYATCRRRASFLSAAFDYGDFICQFETGVDSIARFDAHLEVFTEDAVIRVEYDTPYIRHLPATLRVTGSNSEFGVTRSEGFSARTDTVAIEWRRLHTHICRDERPKCSLADARNDLVIFRDVISAMKTAEG